MALIYSVVLAICGFMILGMGAEIMTEEGLSSRILSGIFILAGTSFFIIALGVVL